ncbi:MAG: glycosyltransferase family 2 protein [Candidatus Obscuribacterales bacterium]|nr:glycosyltransferase family 2 protein [Candidatus Obscuribacterales bacterium]
MSDHIQFPHITHHPAAMIDASPLPANAEAKKADYFISVVIPVYNEEQCLHECFERMQSLFEGIGCKYELVFVNDGSRDSSLDILTSLNQAHPQAVRVVDLSRNFGHQMAITAGIDHVQGDAVVIIDADLQDPPEVIPQLIEQWRLGYDVVHARRAERLDETPIKKLTASMHYRLLSSLSDVKMPLDVGDFKLISKKVVMDLRSLRERYRYMRGLVTWIGYKQTFVDYVRQGRHAGVTKYTPIKMIRLSVNSIVAFSIVPLRLASLCGFLTTIAAGLYLLYALYAKFVMHTAILGWTSVIMAILIIGGMQLTCLGILGEYLGMLCVEIKDRPLYLVNKVL